MQNTVNDLSTLRVPKQNDFFCYYTKVICDWLVLVYLSWWELVIGQFSTVEFNAKNTKIVDLTNQELEK